MDTNTNKTIDNHEADISNLINLGDTALNKLAKTFGIKIVQPTEGGKAQTYEDIQKDLITKKYFEPYISDAADKLGPDKSNDAASDIQDIQDIDSKNVRYAFESIKNEKLAQGVKILSETENEIVFDDGSKIVLHNSVDGRSGAELNYYRKAMDASLSFVDLQVYDNPTGGNNYRISIQNSDGNTISFEEQLTYAKIDEHGREYFDEEALDKFAKYVNNKYSSQDLTVNRSKGQSSESIDVRHSRHKGKYNKGVFEGTVYSKGVGHSEEDYK